MALLERESQLGSLLQYADEARHRAGRLVLISGEAGVGKTTLVEELQAQLPDATWAWGACDGLFTPRPLAPVHDIAREIGGNLLEMVRGAGSRDEIFDAVLHCASAVDGMAVLVVEDAQWADEATLDLLRFLARRVAKLPVLLLVTFRDDALAPSDPLRLALGELAGQRYTRRIDLPAAERGRRTPPGRGLVVLPRRSLRADRRQPVLRGRGAAATTAPRSRRPPATPSWPGLPGSPSALAPRLTWRRWTPGAWTPTSWRAPVTWGSRPSTSWSRSG